MSRVAIVSAKRTAIGSFGGSLKDIPAATLGAEVVKKSLEEINLSPTLVDEVIFGNVLGAGLGQNIARQIAIFAGIPQEKSAFVVNKVCGSGLKSVVLGAQSILLGDNDIVVCGGVENMSAAPYYTKDARFGAKLGNFELEDSIIHDGLTDAFKNYHMGITAENVSEQFGITREMQDELAVTSQNRAEKAQKEGRFDDEIVPVEIKDRKGNVTVIDKDEYIRYGQTVETAAKLRPAFKKDGTVTAGNASGINDGASCLIVMSEEKAKELGVEPLATIVSYASAGVDPKIMGTGPIPASKKAMEKAGLTIDDIDLIEANEAFAAQAYAVKNELGYDFDKVNVNGGAIALGHPIGASGARILTTLLYEMKKRDAKKGLATLCIGGGMGTAVIVER